MSASSRVFHRALRVATVPAACVLVGAGAVAYVSAELTNVTVTNYAVPLQGATAGNVTLDATTPVVLAASLSSSNPQVVSVPSSAVVAPNSSSAVFVASGLAPGCAKITAKLGDRTRLRHVVVHPASRATTLSLTVPNNILVMGGNAPASVKLSIGATGTVTLTSSNPAVASVPASVSLVRSAANFSIAARAEGCATITATSGSQVIQRTVQVVYTGG